MSEHVEDRPERERPELPKTPFLCASCRHGLMVLQKVPVYDRFERRDQPWAEREKCDWIWEARCNNPRIVGRWPETFDAPVVDCEGFEARDLCAAPADPATRKKRDES